MSDLIINWLKTFPYLSEKIPSNNLEDLFSNGYYFGKIFNSHNIFPDMKILKNTEDKDDSFQNYIFLAKTFRKLGIDLTEEDITELIKKKAHKAEIFLYRIKQSLLLNKIQFNEIIEKMQVESQSKLKDEINSRNKNKNLLSRYKSATKRSGPIIHEKKKARLQSAKLPKISSLNFKRIKNVNLNNNNKDIFKEENERIEIKQMQAVIKDIQIFENIHMNKKKVKNDKKNPWDEINYIYDKEALFNKDKPKEKKIDFFYLLNAENKKDKENTDTKVKTKKKSDEEIEKIKSSLNNYNQFKVDNKKKYLNKTHLEKGLSLMGLNTVTMFPSVLKVKGNKIPAELVMKSINDKNKEKLYDDYKSNTTGFYHEKTKKDKNNIKPPASAKRTYSNIKLAKDFANKENKSQIKRPLTAKYLKKKSDKKKIDAKESEKTINTLYINDRSKEIKDKRKQLKKGLTKIEEAEMVPSQNSIPSSITSNIKTEEEENNKNKEQKEKQITIKLTDEEKRKKIEQKKRQYFYDIKNIKEIISSIIDITEVYYEYQNNTGSEFIDLEKFNKISYNFIHNKNLVKRKKEIKIIIEEEKGNLHFNVYDKIDEKFLKNFGDVEKNELKNYLFHIGKKYDKTQNNLYVKKLGLKPVSLEINDIMGEEIEILFKKALAEGKDARDEEDEEEIKRTGIIKYRPSREEEEIIAPISASVLLPEYHFTSLISEIIKFAFDKDKNKEINEKEIKDININNNNIDNEAEVKNENNLEDKVSFKEILNSIPVKISFIGLMNTEIKLIIKNSLNKYPKLKVYNPIEFLNDLRLKKQKIDEINMKKFLVDQLKKEKANLTEEIKDYFDLLENKDNLTDDEICIKILQGLIKKDFEQKNLENLKQEIITKRENINTMNEKINAIKEEQNQGKKINQRDIDNLQQQIDKIYFDSIMGFVLINFPNNINQSLLMEKYLMNFIQPCEQSISEFDMINDKLLFICDKELKNQKFNKFEPSLEKIVLFHCANEKLIKEEDMNINMATQVQSVKVNQIQENGGQEFNKEQIEKFKNSFKEMEEFYQNFNIKIDKYDYYEGIEEENNVILNNNNINWNSNGFIQRDKVILEKLKSSLIIYEEELVPKIVNDNILADESYDEVMEDVNQIKDKESSRKISGDSSLKPASNNSKAQIKSIPKKESNNSSTLKNNEMSKLSPEKEKDKDKEKPTSQKINKNKQKIISTIQLSEEEKYTIYKTWSNFIEQYNYYIYKIFYRENNLKRKKIEEELIDIQKNFIQFLVNPEEQKILVNQFIEKYKCLRDTFCKNKITNKESNKIIIENFQKDISELNDALWDVAKIRKNQAFYEIEKIEKNNNINRELNICYFKLERLIILESQNLITTINIFIRYFTLTFNPKFIANNNNIMPQFILDTDLSLAEEILKDLDNEEYAKQINEKTIIYPRANRLYKNTFRFLIKIYIFIDNFYNKISTKDKKGNIASAAFKSTKIKKSKTKKPNTQNTLNSDKYNQNTKVDLQNQIRFAIKSHIKKYKNKVYNLYMNSLEDLSKIYCPFKQIIKLMDEWIILSMELQINNINKAIKELDLTNNYRINTNNPDEKIEKSIVDLIISENDEFYNYEFTGINPDDFALFDQNKFLGIYEIDKKESIYTNDDYYKIYEYIKEFDILTKLRNSEIQKGIITQDKFEEIFFKFGLFDNFDKFPKIFKSIDYHNVSNFFSHFSILSSEFNKDNNNKDNTNEQKLLYTNDILTVLVLSCVLIDKGKIEEKYNKIENIYMNEEQFMENNFGFEDELIINTNDKDKDDRVKQMKLLLFNINKTYSEVPEINVKKFLDLLLLKPIKNLNEEMKIGKYFDLFYK